MLQSRCVIHPIPIIGVNFGGKGFLAGLEDDELDMLLEIADGQYTVSRRMMLDVELVRNERIICTQSVLNDVVIHGGHVDCIGVTAYGDGVPITRFNGDGIIVAHADWFHGLFHVGPAARSSSRKTRISS